MRTAIWDYAQTHEDAFPKSLRDLEHGSIPPEARHFHDPQSKQEEDWLYFPGYNRSSSPPETIILASPSKVDSHRRIAFFADGSGQLVEESDFFDRLSRQLNSE